MLAMLAQHACAAGSLRCCASDNPVKIFYETLAEWWPLISPVDDYRDEAELFKRLIERRVPRARTLLELGSGGGGLFSETTWVRLLERTGFSVEVVDEETDEERTPRRIFFGRKASTGAA